jgi:hypothetical protein
MSQALTNTCVFVTSKEDVTGNSAMILHSSTNHKQEGEDPKPKKKREKKKKAQVGEKTAQTRARKEREIDRHLLLIHSHTKWQGLCQHRPDNQSTTTIFDTWSPRCYK